MRKQALYSRSNFYRVVPVVIITIGIILRLLLYLDNRCLWTDEVDVALNIHDKPYLSLAKGLDHRQYAPPIFLWVTKVITSIFGYGEKALRLYPFLSGIISLLLLQSIFKKMKFNVSSWYPLLIFATGYIYLRYGTDLKQYMPDAFVTLVLIRIALSSKIQNYNDIQYFTLWFLLGSIAIWASMPAVFVLAGVGTYLLVEQYKDKNYKRLRFTIIISSLWLLQFGIYYFLLLKDSIDSDYLISYHSKYFLYATPANSEEWTHNLDLIKLFFQQLHSDNSYLYIYNLLLVLAGLLHMVLMRKTELILFLLPFLLMLIAAAVNQYSLIPRLTMFSMPLILILLGAGLQYVYHYTLKVFIFAISILCMISIISGKPFETVAKPIKIEETTSALNDIVQRNYSSKEVYVYTGAIHTFDYYTRIHPDKNNWASIKKANIINFNVNIDSLIIPDNEEAALFYTIPFDSYDTHNKFLNHMSVTDTFMSKGCTIFYYTR